MIHILDNPIWNALGSGNSRLAFGTATVKYFSPEIAPFAGLEAPGQDALKILYDLVPPESTKVLITAVDMSIPEPWQIVNKTVILQLTGEHLISNEKKITGCVRPLQESDVPAMLALTALTRPGPFAQRTIEFGGYRGIFCSEKLAAMAGRRFHAGNYVEISAVCTHPDYTGRGYAATLILDIARSIVEEGLTPFLHVRDDNHRAIALYEKLGFRTRAAVNVNVIRKVR